MTVFRHLRDRVNAEPEQPRTKPAPLVAGGYGIVRGAKHDVDTSAPAPQPRKLSPREAAALMQAEILAAMQHLTMTTTELTALIGRQGTANGVLRVELRAVDATGAATFTHQVTVGSVLIENLGANPMTVQIGAGGGGTAPAGGTGLQRIAAGQVRRIPIGNRDFVVYGTPGDLLNVQAFTGLQAYGG